MKRMSVKTFLTKLFSILLILFISQIAFSSCENAIQTFDETVAEQNQEADDSVSLEEIQTAAAKNLGIVKINIANIIEEASTRTIIPKTNAANLTDISISAIKNGETKTFGPWATYADLANADTIELEPGTWNITLTANNSGFIFQDVKSVNVVLGQSRSAAFELSSSATQGGVDFKLSFSQNPVAVVYSLKNLLSNTVINTGALDIQGSGSSKFIRYQRSTSNLLNIGYYRLEITFYGDNAKTILLNTYSEVINVKGGFISTAERSINLNQMYSITYNCYDGTPVDASGSPVSLQESYSMHTGEIILPDLQKSGFIFEGWYENPPDDSGIFSGSKVTSIPSNASGNKVLYAKLTPVVYTITYELNEGGYISGYEPPSTYLITSSSISLPTSSHISRNRYFFKGWYDNSSFSGNAVTRINTGSYGDKTFYAKWESAVVTSTVSNFDEVLQNVIKGSIIKISESLTDEQLTAIATSITNGTKDVGLDLSEVTGLTSIPQDAFKNCSKLISIDLPDSVTQIGREAFNSCIHLRDVSLPANLTSIGFRAFCACIIREIILPEGIETIDSQAFSSCNLRNIIIPASVTSLGNDSLNCSFLSNITVDPSNTVYKDIDGVLYLKDETVLYTYPSARGGGEYIIPDSVSKIEKNAFYGCKNTVTNLIISANVIEIGRYAFRECHIPVITFVDTEGWHLGSIDGEVMDVSVPEENTNKFTSGIYRSDQNAYYKTN